MAKPDVTPNSRAPRKRSEPVYLSNHFVLGCAAAALIAAAGSWAFHNTFNAPWVLDDATSIVANPTIRRLGTAWFPPQGAGITVEGRPLLNVSFALNYALSGTAVASYHAVNLLIHLLAGLTLFGVVRRTLRLSGDDAVSLGRATFIALGAALLWTVHPLQTESVTYVVQRAESLAGLLYLLTLYFFIRGPRFYVASVAAALLGMATKEVVVTAPLLIALYDRIFLTGSWRELWQRRHRYYAALATTWLLQIALVAGAGSRGGTIGPSAGLAWWQYALSQSYAIIHYLRLVVWPAPLIIDYGSVFIGWRAALPFLGLDAALLLSTAVLLRRKPRLGFIALAFFLLLAPSSSVIGGTRQMLAEHRMYLALAPLAVLVAFGLSRLSHWTAAATLSLLVLALGTVTVKRNAVYATELSLYADTAAHRPHNAFAQANYGYALAQAGRPDLALERFQTAVQLKPDYAQAQFNLGVILCGFGRTAEGIAHYRLALQLEPNYPDAHNNLGVALAQGGRVEEAAEHFAAAVRLRPDFADAAANLTAAERQLGRR